MLGWFGSSFYDGDIGMGRVYGPGERSLGPVINIEGRENVESNANSAAPKRDYVTM
jgi:hypothetical protein